MQWASACIMPTQHSAAVLVLQYLPTWLGCGCGLLQVLRIVVEATGMARRLCAPREVIVERVFKRCEALAASSMID
jgi:hypothetical protein